MQIQTPPLIPGGEIVANGEVSEQISVAFIPAFTTSVPPLRTLFCNKADSRCPTMAMEVVAVAMTMTTVDKGGFYVLVYGD